MPPTSSDEMSASMCSGIPVGSASTRSSRVTCCTTPPSFAPGDSPTSWTDDGRLDRLVEPHLVEVDVRERAADRMLLVLLEHRVVRRLLPLDHDVDDRVQPRRVGERRPQVALLDEDRAGVTLAVEDAGNEPLLAEAANATRADLVGIAGGDLESDAVARHRRTMVAEGI